MGRQQGEENRFLPSMLPPRWEISCYGGLGPTPPLCQLCLPHVNIPKCVNVFSICLQNFRYHENVNDWNFGKLSALREIAMAVEGGYRYYYMGKQFFLPYSPAFDFTIGYYIHSCIKMRYKATFRPQYVLG